MDKQKILTSKILKLSNSAIYSKRREITNLSYAITFHQPPMTGKS